MNGHVLNYDMKESVGLITGEDGQRYEFSAAEWKESDAPHKGMLVEFVPEQGAATGVYLSVNQVAEQKTGDEWYKSNDQKVFAGVCSGLAHKFEVSVSALRVVTVLSSLIMGAPLFIYIGMWIFLPAKSTRS